MIYSKNIFILMIVSVLIFTACVERGKPVIKEEATIANSKDKKILDHYTCPKGHKGSEKQGTCAECGSVLTHNQAFHGTSGVALPRPTLDDPFQPKQPAANPGPAQNSFGDFHYVCSTGHPGGSGSLGKCTTCQAQLVHNQLYHR